MFGLFGGLLVFGMGIVTTTTGFSSIDAAAIFVGTLAMMAGAVITANGIKAVVLEAIKEYFKQKEKK